MYVKILIKKITSAGNHIVHTEIAPKGNLETTIFQLGQRFKNEPDGTYVVETLAVCKNSLEQIFVQA